MILPRALPVFALVVLSAAAAAAATPKEKAEARTLVTQAKKATKERRFAAAATALKRADELDSSPQTRLDLAAALAADQKLVEASRVLHGITDGAVATPATRRFHDQAKKDLAAVEPRIPWIQIDVGGPSPGSAQTTIDGKEIDASSEVPSDPGDHEILVRADGFQNGTRSLSLREGAHEHLHLDLTPLAKAGPPPKSAGGSKAPAITLFALGGAGLLVGGGAGIAALMQTKDARALCNGNTCPPSAASAIEKSKLSGTISTVGFIAGGTLVGAGIIALIVSSSGDAKKEAPKEGARVRPWIGLGEAGFYGKF